MSKLGQSDPAWERIKYNFSVTPLAIEQAKAAVKELVGSWEEAMTQEEDANAISRGLDPEILKHWKE